MPDVPASFSLSVHITVDHFQVFLQDSDCAYDDDALNPIRDMLETLYNADSMARHLGASRYALAIMTASFYGSRRFDIEMREAAPDENEDLTPWDNVAEASIETPSGTLLLAGPEETEKPIQIAMQPGVYRVRAYAAHTDVPDEIAFDGDDSYRLVLWPAPYAAPALLKSAEHRW